MFMMKDMMKDNLKTYNSGIDLLRLLAFAYVVVLHTLGHGGILGASTFGSHQYMLCAGMEIWTYCAVNLFGLISGYVGYSDTPPKPFRKRVFSYLELWLQVVFYAVLPSVIIYIAVPGTITVTDILKGFLPVTTGQYWYFSAYTGLFLLMPVLNAALRSLDIRYLRRFLIIFLVAFSAYASPMERFALREGYSTFWLVLLYLAGGAVKKIRMAHEEAAAAETDSADLSRAAHKKTALICFAGIPACALFAWIWLINGWHFSVFDIEVKRTTWMSYTSFTVTLAALLHLVWFSGIRVPEKFHRPLRLAASCAFAIYLVNTQPALWKLTDKLFASCGTGPLVSILLVTAANVVVFMAAGILADIIRRALFSGVRRLFRQFFS